MPRIAIHILVCAILISFALTGAYSTEIDSYGVEAPCFSPDGRKITFVSDVLSENPDIYTVNVDGTGLVQLTHTPDWESEPVWSPNGNTIAYTSARESLPVFSESVMIMNSDGSNQQKISSGLYNESSPSWLPDGLAVVVVTYRTDNADLILLSLAGVEVKFVAASIKSESSPDCSRDGKWVVYKNVYFVAGSEVDEMYSNIWKRRLDDITCPSVQLTSGQHFDTNPKFSPDGTKILFESDRDGSTGGSLWVMDADGTNLTGLTIEGDLYDPAWSPDGKKIAFVRSVAVDGRCVQEIWTANADGTNMRQVTHLDALYVR